MDKTPTEKLASRSSTARRAVKSATLAISAESIGSEAEALTAGRLAGDLAHQGGLTVDEMWDAFPGFRRACAVWYSFVDGWHDSAAAQAA
jgi:hypothetical protein